MEGSIFFAEQRCRDLEDTVTQLRSELDAKDLLPEADEADDGDGETSEAQRLRIQVISCFYFFKSFGN
jgi:hypothetical protein